MHSIASQVVFPVRPYLMILLFSVFAGYVQVQAQSISISSSPTAAQVCPDQEYTYQVNNLLTPLENNYNVVYWQLTPTDGYTLARGSFGPMSSSITIRWDKLNGRPGKITVTAIPKANPSTALTASYSISQPSAPTLSSASKITIAANASYCSSKTNTFSISSPQNGFVYEWYFPNGGAQVVSTSGQGSRQARIQWTTATTTNVTVGVKARSTAGATCSSIFSELPRVPFQITTNPIIPANTQISGPTAVCPGGIYTYTLTNAIENATGYIWTAPTGSTFVLSGDEKSATVTLAGASGTVTVRGSNACGTSPAVTLPIQLVAPIANAGGISGPLSVCRNRTYTYAIPAIAGATYQWVTPSGATLESGQNTNTAQIRFTESAFAQDANGKPTPEQIRVSVGNPCTPVPVSTAPYAITLRDPQATLRQVFSDTDLTNREAKTLTLNTCDQVDVNLCNGRTIRQATLKAVLDTRFLQDIHAIPTNATAYPTALTFDVTGLNEAGQTILSRRNVRLAINANQPEQIFALDFTALHSRLVSLSIRPVTYTGPTDANIASNIAFRVFYEESFDYNSASLTVAPAALQLNPATYEQSFRWLSSCPGVTQYQLQVLRLYQQATPTGNGPDEPADWSKALTLDVETQAQPINGENVFSQVLALAEGSGDYRWRVRAIGTAQGGIANPLNWGPWSGEQSINDYIQPDQAANQPGGNWIYSRTFTEGGRISERMSFANGLGQIAQSQTKIQSQDQVVVAETKQDYTGRDALQTLPVPIPGKNRLGYLGNMLRDSQGNAYLKDKFDSDARYKTPEAAQATGYYSGADVADAKGVTVNEGVADAEGYPYTRTLYTADGTNRVKEQGGVGGAHKLGSGHTVKTYYASVAEDEIIKLFGEEAPRAANMHKTITSDPNGTTSVTYQTKDGKTIATALVAGTGSAGLDKLPSNDGQLKPIAETITEKTPFNGIGTSSRKPLVFSIPTDLAIRYALSAQTIQDLCAANTCKNCDYLVEILLMDQDNLETPKARITRLLPAGACSAALQFSPVDTVVRNLTGSFVLEKRVTAHNRASGAADTYLEQQITQLKQQYSEENLMAGGDWVQIQQYIKANQADNLYRFLQQRNYPLVSPLDRQAYYEVPLVINAECEEIRIHIPVVEKACQTCDFPANDPSKGFEGYFAGKALAKTLVDVLDPARAIGWQAGEVNSMILAMLSEKDASNRNLYSCSQLWGCWQQAVDQYAESLADTDPKPVATIPNVPSDLGQYSTGNYQYNLLDEFFACVDVVKAGYHSNLPWTTANRLEAYKTFYVNIARLTDTGDPAAECKRQLDANAALNPAGQEYIQRFNIFEACLKTGVKTTAGEAGMVADKLKQQMLESIGNTCLARREEYRQQLVNTIHTREQKLIEGLDANALTEDPSVDFIYNGTVQPLRVAAGDPLPEGFVFTESNSYQLCQVEAMADAMVTFCQKGVSAQTIQLAGQNTPEGQAAYKKIENILLHGFDVQIGGTCGSGFDLIDPANIGGNPSDGTGSLPVVPLTVTQTGPAGVGNPQNNMAWLDASSLAITEAGQSVNNWTDRSGNNRNATQTAGTRLPKYYPALVNGKPAVRFDGTVTDNLQLPYFTVKNDFTIFSIAQPTLQHQILGESTSSIQGIYNQRYLLYAMWGGRDGNDGNVADAGSGLSVGTNGISAIEHAGYYMPALAVYDGPVSGFNSITLQYNAKQPRIYLNDALARTGLVSQRTGDVYPSSQIGGPPISELDTWRQEGQYGDFQGDVAEMIWFNYTLPPTQRTIVENYLAAKYNLTTANDYYTSHAPAYHLDVQGIGTLDGIEKHTQAANGKGLIVTELSSSLNAAAEFVFAGHSLATNDEVAIQLPAGITKRWQRDWYIQKTGAADVQLTFDFAAAGMTIPADLGTAAARYRLLYRAAPTQNFTALPATVTLNDNNRLSFTLADAQLANGYYTLGLGEDTPLVGDLSSALIAYWRFEEQQGTAVKDASCNGRDGTMMEAGSWTQNGKLGGGYINPPGKEGSFYSNINWTPTAFTVSYWMNPTILANFIYNMGAGWDQRFVSHTTVDGGMVVGTDVATRMFLPAGTVKTNEWQHFGFTFSNGTGKLYRNAQLIATKTGMTMPLEWVTFAVGTNDMTSRGVIGKLDEFAIFNRALTGAEVASVAAATGPLALAACPDPNCRPTPKLCFKYNALSVAETPIEPADGLDPVYVLDFKPEDCDAIQTRPIANAIQGQLADFAERKTDAYRSQYQTVCVAQEGLVEDFRFSYALGYHHYTLYYYDRAGNLTATVPPEGVDKGFLATGTRATRPAHRLKTTYTYNSLGQLVRQHTPDGGTTDFYYNNKSQLRYSQNDKQRNAAGAGNQNAAWFSYTKYDPLGRVVEVGESSQTPDVLRGKTEDPGFPVSGLRQRTTTTYSLPASGVAYAPPGAAASGGGQRHLQNRVSYTQLDPDPNVSGDEQTTHYSYDPHGNVEWLCQKLPPVAGSEFAKYVRYEYDLISGKVLRVNYQENTPEQFYHRYGYDEDNRLTRVETSTDGVVWDTDATYRYYRHGPLQRMELGEDRVQGTDYTYTIHGWLKAINGQAEAAQSAAQPVPADAFRMALTYYSGDYRRTGTGGVDAALNPAAGRDLFNGNIAAWSRQIAPRPGGPGGQSFDGQVTSEQFTYDELNRLKTSTFQSLSGPAAAAGAYATSYGYDPNGNLLTLTRNDQRGRAIDNLTYRYNRDAGGQLTNNKLRGVADGSGQALGVVNQPATDNYTYDEIGNLTGDAQDGIQIEWTVYGKVKTVTKTDGSQKIEYLYDASGNRTVKTVRTVNLQTNVATVLSTYYVRDAQGNVLSVYDDNGTPLRQKELYLYGSSRLGIFRPNGSRSLAANGIYSRVLQRKEYELADHLGNVRAVIGDNRESDGSNPIRAALRSYANYYAFGLEMPGMAWKGGNSYRYGYNGKEIDKDFANNYDYGFRIYNPGVARFLSVDPLSDKFPWYTPYQFAGNKPIENVDLDGAEEFDARNLYNTKGYLDVDMTGTPTNVSGVKTNGETFSRPTKYTSPANAPRNSLYYWQEIARRQQAGDIPQMLSDANLAKIQNGAAPTADNTWIRFNPQHADYEDDILIHHHKDRMSIATAIPNEAHERFTQQLHRSSRVATRANRYALLKNRTSQIASSLGRAMSVVSAVVNIFGVISDSPHSTFNVIYSDNMEFMSEPTADKIYFHATSGTYIKIDQVSTIKSDPTYISTYIKWTIFKDYKKENGKWVGVDPVGKGGGSNSRLRGKDEQLKF